MIEHENIESFHEAEYSEHMIVLAEGDLWLAWESEDGEWWVTRPRHEDDAAGPEGDPSRPIGPSPLDGLQFPIRCVSALAGFADVEVGSPDA